MKKIDEKKKLSSQWFKELRDKICKELEKFEISGKKFKKKAGTGMRKVRIISVEEK